MESKNQKREKLSLLWRFLKGSKRFFLATVLSAGVTALADMIQPQIIRAAVDCAIGGKEGDFPAFVMDAVNSIGGFKYLGENLWIMALCVMVVAAFQIVSQYTFRVYNTKASETLVKTMRDQLFGRIERLPFAPADKAELQERCAEILQMQAAALATRLRHTRAKCAVIGLSGGLDSTLALIATVHAFDLLGWERRGILAVTMPCFGTTTRTKSNAEKLAEAYGARLECVDIKEGVAQHFRDIGHEEDKLDVTFENAQARMRTYILMDLANMYGGMVIGTGDLSELALGWATYNGDHMSMYGVNGSIPKTLVRYLTAYEASQSAPELKEILLDVLGTPVSPELLPPKDGEISQKTEELVGPYELHDFYLYYMLRYDFAPTKIYTLACRAFENDFDCETIKKWLKSFCRRFFTQQFKRSCMPDCVKVGSISLSPRGDWRMPSDASARIWLEEVDRL